MPGPEKNFTQPVNLSIIFDSPMPQLILTPAISAFSYNKRQVFVFFKFGLVKQSGTVNIIGNSKIIKTLITLPLPPMIKQVLVTFSPIYKTRTGRQRPLKGQLWPRTR
jgi:hypothetical protein